MSGGRRGAGSPVQPPAETQIFQQVVVRLRDGTELELRDVSYAVQLTQIGSSQVIFQEQTGERRVHIFPLVPTTEIQCLTLTPSRIQRA